MNKQLEEAIKRLEHIDRYYDCNNYYSKYDLDCIETVLKELKRLQEETIEKDKIREIKKQIELPNIIVGGRRNAKTLEYGKRLGKIELCKELLEEK